MVLLRGGGGWAISWPSCRVRPGLKPILPSLSDPWVLRERTCILTACPACTAQAFLRVDDEALKSFENRIRQVQGDECEWRLFVGGRGGWLVFSFSLS